MQSFEASDLPSIKPNFGSRSPRSAEGEATGKLPIDLTDYQKAKVLSVDEKSGAKTISTEEGIVLTLTKDQIGKLLSEPTI
jgi:hypothetical protein